MVNEPGDTYFHAFGTIIGSESLTTVFGGSRCFLLSTSAKFAIRQARDSDKRWEWEYTVGLWEGGRAAGW